MAASRGDMACLVSLRRGLPVPDLFGLWFGRAANNAETLLELIYTAFSIDKLFLAGEERVGI